MPYRENPSKDDLFRMLTEANKEKEKSADRIKELEAKLTNISTTVKGHERKVTHVDVSNMTPKELDKVLVKRKSKWATRNNEEDDWDDDVHAHGRWYDNDFFIVGMAGIAAVLADLALFLLLA